MPSEQTPQFQNSLQGGRPLTSRPLASDIQKGLVDGNSIADFIAKNIRSNNPDGVNAMIQQDVDSRAPVQEPSPLPVTSPESTGNDVIPDISVGDPEDSEDSEDSQQENPSEEEPVEGDSEDDSEEEELSGSAADNFKKLRTKVKEIKEESKHKDKLLEELTSELKAYATGQKIPEELSKREARLAELEQYEKILNLKKSKYYQDKFVAPLNNIRTKLEKIADEYNVDPGKLKAAANIQNEADLNRFLSSNFDIVGASEIKRIIGDYKVLQAEAAQAENDPEQTLNNLISSAQEARKQEKVKQMERMQDITRNIWRKSLDDIKAEGKIRELIYKEGDVEHNSKVFTPIVQAAATEYGKLVNQLAANGLENLPEPLAYALSRLCQLAHASAIAIDSRERAVSIAEEVETNVRRTQRYIRPSVSGQIRSKTGGKEGNGAGGGPGSPMEAAERLLASVRRM